MNDLTTKTCKELREIAKGFNIVGRWDMKKAQLIEAIEQCDWTDADISFETDCIIKEGNSNQSEGSQKVTKTTLDYLNNIEAGTLVAFKRDANKDIAMSGKFVSFEKGKVIVESKKGTKFKLRPDEIVWVKTGDRWPKWVFNLFNNSDKEENIDNGENES